MKNQYFFSAVGIKSIEREKKNNCVFLQIRYSLPISWLSIYFCSSLLRSFFIRFIRFESFAIIYKHISNNCCCDTYLFGVQCSHRASVFDCGQAKWIYFESCDTHIHVSHKHAHTCTHCVCAWFVVCIQMPIVCCLTLRMVLLTSKFDNRHSFHKHNTLYFFLSFFYKKFFLRLFRLFFGISFHQVDILSSFRLRCVREGFSFFILISFFSGLRYVENIFETLSNSFYR